MEIKESCNFTGRNLVAVLLPLLRQNGICKINENDLERKLFYYYQNSDFGELFQDVGVLQGINHTVVNLHKELHLEKNFSTNILFEKMQSDLLYLGYENDWDFACHEQSLSENGKLKIRQIAKELGIRTKAEQNSSVKINILGVDPNCHYSLVYGKSFAKSLGFELITDGAIASIDYLSTNGNQERFYESPSHPDKAIQFKNASAVDVKLENATYAIKQAIVGDEVRYCNIYTQNLDFDKLQQIVNIAGQSYDTSEDILTEEKPYVRKYVLR